MSTIPENLSSELQQCALELKRLEQRLKSECPPDPVVLNEFRHTVDNVRLTTWSVSELVNAERIKKNPDTVLAFLSAERLRRFDQLVKNSLRRHRTWIDHGANQWTAIVVGFGKQSPAENSLTRKASDGF
jgi:hypothetical protein